MPLYSGKIYSNCVHSGLCRLRDRSSLPLNLKFIFKVFLMLGFRNWSQLSSNSDHMWSVLCKYCTTGSLLYISLTTFIQSANMIHRKNGTKPVLSTIYQEYFVLWRYHARGPSVDLAHFCSVSCVSPSGGSYSRFFLNLPSCMAQ